MRKEVWISFLDENNIKREGWFILLEQGESFVKIETGQNIFTIPYARILKIKERKNGN